MAIRRYACKVKSQLRLVEGDKELVIDVNRLPARTKTELALRGLNMLLGAHTCLVPEDERFAAMEVDYNRMLETGEVDQSRNPRKRVEV